MSRQARVPARCNLGCRKRFSIDLEERPEPDGSVVQQFTCPHCRRLYRVARISPRGLELRKDLHVRMGRAKSEKRREELLAEFKAEVTRLVESPPQQPNRAQRRAQRRAMRRGVR